jgi:hypothetical protein
LAWYVVGCCATRACLSFFFAHVSVIVIGSPLQPPFYSENVNTMYELIQTAPLRFPSFLKEETRSVLTGVCE